MEVHKMITATEPKMCIRDRYMIASNPAGRPIFKILCSILLYMRICERHSFMPSVRYISVTAVSYTHLKMLYRIIVTFLRFAVLMVCEHTGRMDGWNKIVLFVIYLVPYLVIGYDIVYKAARNISHGPVSYTHL